MGCSNASEIEDKISSHQYTNPSKPKRISNRIKKKQKRPIYNIENPLCNILVYTRSEKEKEIPEILSNGSQEDTTFKIVNNRYPITIKEDNMEFDNDNVIPDNSELHGIWFDKSIKKMEKVDLSKEATIQMVKTAVVESKKNKKRKTLEVNEKQIKIIGEIIFEVLNDIDEYDLTKPVTHKDLNYVYVKVAMKSLSNEYLQANCYKHKNISQKELKNAVKEVEKGNEVDNIKVLTIQIC